MACINPDGTMTEMARKVLAAVGGGVTATELSGLVGAPLYRVRSTMRELVEAGLVVEAEGAWALSPAGQARVQAPA